MGVCDSESVARTFYGSRNMAQMRMHKGKSALSPQRVIHPIQFMFVKLNGRFRHRWPLTSSGETVPSSCCHAALIPVLPVKQSFQVHCINQTSSSPLSSLCALYHRVLYSARDFLFYIRRTLLRKYSSITWISTPTPTTINCTVHCGRDDMTSAVDRLERCLTGVSHCMSANCLEKFNAE